MNHGHGSCLIVGGCTIDAVVDRQGVWQNHLCGGNSLFAAAGASYWLPKQTIKVFSRVGFDYPQDWLDSVAQAGIDITGIERLPLTHNGLFAASYDPMGQRTMHDPAQMSAETQQQAAQQSSTGGHAEMDIDPVLGSDWMENLTTPIFVHCAPLSPAVLFHNLHHLRQPGIWLQVDPGEESAAWSKEERGAVFKTIDAYLPSVEEVDDDTRKVLDVKVTDLKTAKPDTIVVKRGIEGSLIYQRSTRRCLAIPAVPVDATDPTGAGDAYCGGFLAGMAVTGNPAIAGLTGTVSASFVVECYGVIDALRPGVKRIWERLNWLVEETGFKLSIEDERVLHAASSI
jgi:sugar/nucleoside kinase (ribokinase family)